MQFPIHVSYRAETCYLIESCIIAYISKKYLLLHLLIYYHDMPDLYSGNLFFTPDGRNFHLLIKSAGSTDFFIKYRLKSVILLKSFP